MRSGLVCEPITLKKKGETKIKKHLTAVGEGRRRRVYDSNSPIPLPQKWAI
jgi:hypothetical protein